MMRWLHLRLRAPLISFGGAAIDVFGVDRDFPAQSMLAGLIANALGWTRDMRVEHQELQNRLIFGAVHEHPPTSLTDYQTAKIHQHDCAWSTTGTPTGRKPSPSYKGRDERGRWLTVQQWRDYGVDMSVSVVMRLHPAELDPTLDAVAAALRRPVRVLFVGRKHCLPSVPILVGAVDASDARTALRAVAPPQALRLPAMWPASEGEEEAHRQTEVTDERNWISGLHGGARRVCKGRLAAVEGDPWQPI